MLGKTIAFPDYSFYSTPELIAAYAAGGERLREAVAGLGENELRARPRGPHRWSIHEILLHTADSESQAALRFKKVWSGDPGPLPWHDQDVWAREVDYQGQSAEARDRALTLIGLVRQQTLPLLSRATERDWIKTGEHAELGTLTMRNLLELYADHGERHLEQILDSRARLDRPLVITPLLPRRLY